MKQIQQFFPIWKNLYFYLFLSFSHHLHFHLHLPLIFLSTFSQVSYSFFIFHPHLPFLDQIFRFSFFKIFVKEIKKIYLILTFKLQWFIFRITFFLKRFFFSCSRLQSSYETFIIRFGHTRIFLASNNYF